MLHIVEQCRFYSNYGGNTMSKEIIIDNEFVSLWYHQEAKIIHHEIKKYVFGTELQKMFLKGSDVMKEKGAKKWLSDDRKNNALTQKDTEWVTTVWFPKTVENGWKYWAIVQPEKLIGQMNVQKFAETYAAKGIVAKIFSDPDEAMKWLIAQ